MTQNTENKFITALKNLKIEDWSFTGNDPTNEEEFLASFNKCVGVDSNQTAIMSNDPKDFGVTWSQVKAEMDKL